METIQVVYYTADDTPIERVFKRSEIAAAMSLIEGCLKRRIYFDVNYDTESTETIQFDYQRDI